MWSAHSVAACTSTESLLPPGLLGYDEKLRGYDYDPERARTLLQQAGYGNGFTLHIMSLNIPGVTNDTLRVHVGGLRADEVEQLGRVARLADDVEPRPLEEACKPLPEQDVVIRKRDPDRVRLDRHEAIIRDAGAATLT